MEEKTKVVMKLIDYKLFKRNSKKNPIFTKLYSGIFIDTIPKIKSTLSFATNFFFQ